MKLAIENFQSIRLLRTEFVPGLTVITGPTGSGKTAIIRAIVEAVDNPKGCQGDITTGQDRARVAMKFPGMDVVTWCREEKTCSYKYGKADMTKAGGTDLIEICPQSPFIRDFKGKIVNIQTEWDHLFPYDYSPTELFRLFEGMFNFSDTKTITTQIREDERKYNLQLTENSAQAVLFANQKMVLEEGMKELSPVDFRVVADKLDEALSAVESLTPDVSFVVGVVGVVRQVKLLPAKYTLNEEVFSGVQELEQALATVKSAQAYEQVPTQVMVLTTDLSALRVLESDFKDVQEAKRVLELTRELKQFQVTVDFGLIERMRKDAREAELILGIGDIPQRKEFNIRGAEVLTLGTDVNTVIRLQEELRVVEKEFDEQTALFVGATRRLREFPNCPHCGAAQEDWK